jgi:CRP-like cAMP-binding protein
MKIRPQKTTAAGQADEVGVGDALGIITVHVNRVLQQMRASGVIVTTGARLTVPD